MLNIDAPTLTVVLLVVAGSGWLAGYLSGRTEREQTQRQRVQLRRARREELRHRAPELEPDVETIEPTAPDTDEETFTGYQRFAYDGQPVRHSLAPGWRKDFDGIAEALRGQADPMDWSTPLFHATGAALLGPTGQYSIVGTHPDQPQPGGGDPTIPVKPVRVLRKHKRAARKAAEKVGVSL